MSDHLTHHIEFEAAPMDASWRLWSQDEFWLVLWLIESTASVVCLIPPDARPELQRKVKGLVKAVLAHQVIRDHRRKAGFEMHSTAALILSRETVADRLDALQNSGLQVRFRPSGRRSAIELAIAPRAG
jgi:hypothetical protein